MTVASAVSRSAYTGDGVATVYPFPFRVLSAANLRVITRSATTGVETVLVYPSQFTVSGVGNSSGGSVTLTTPITAGDTLVIRRAPAIVQSTDLANQGRYAPADTEAALDLRTMVEQYLYDALGRVPMVQETRDPAALTLTLTPEAGKVLAWTSGSSLGNANIDTSGTTGVVLPPSTPARTVTTLSAYLANNAVFNLLDFGCVGDGVADDTPKILNAVAAAIAANKGFIRAPGGKRYRCTAQITMASAVWIQGDGAGPAGGINESANPFTTFLHDFNGDLFVWTGANGIGPGSGGGIENCRIVQTFGLPALTGGAGSAIVFRAVDSTHKPSWCKVLFCVIEENYTFKAPWTWAINVDGIAGSGGILDLYLSHVSTHTSGTAPGAGALRLDGAQQPVIDNCTFYNTGALVKIGDTNSSSTCQFMNCQAGTLSLDRAVATQWIGGVLSNVTDTANTSGDSLVAPYRFNGTFTPVTSAVGMWFYSSTLVVGGATGGFVFLRPIVIPNLRYYSGTKAGGGTVAMLGLDGSDNVRVTSNADAITIIGSAVSTAGLANGDTLIGGTCKITGNLQRLSTGAAPRAGLAVLVAGTKVVASTAVTASTVIFLTRRTAGGTIGDLTYVLNAGVGFTINSANALDTSTVAWVLMELN